MLVGTTTLLSIPISVFTDCEGLEALESHEIVMHHCVCRDVFGDTAILGDHRWAGAYGVDADFISSENCSIARIRTHHIQVCAADALYCIFLHVLRLLGKKKWCVT